MILKAKGKKHINSAVCRLVILKPLKVGHFQRVCFGNPAPKEKWQNASEGEKDFRSKKKRHFMGTFMSMFWNGLWEKNSFLGMLGKFLDFHVHFMLIEFLKFAGHHSGDKFLAPLHVLDSQPLLFWAQLYIQTSLLPKRKEENRRRILASDFWTGLSYRLATSFSNLQTRLVLLGWMFFCWNPWH